MRQRRDLPLPTRLLAAALPLVVWPLVAAVPVAAVSGANLQRPSWSPDGTQLSFEANFHDEKRIELYVGEPEEGGFDVVKVRQHAATSLTAGFQTTSETGVVHELAWAPRFIGHYVFAASNDALDYDLYVSEGAALAPAPGADGGASWSPNGRWIAFSSARTGEGDLYLLDVKSIEKDPVRITNQPTSAELYVDWSHDSTQLVFVGHSESGDNLWLLPAMGAPPARLTAWPGNQIRPRFAPTDDRIAFYANHEDGERFDLYVVQPGSAPRLMVRGVYPDARGPSWTPDGRHLVYVADDDAQLDPVRAVSLGNGSITTLPLDTVGHGDLDLVVRGDMVWLAVVAQGRRADPVRDFKRLFVDSIPALP